MLARQGAYAQEREAVGRRVRGRGEKREAHASVERRARQERERERSRGDNGRAHRGRGACAREGVSGHNDVGKLGTK